MAGRNHRTGLDRYRPNPYTSLHDLYGSFTYALFKNLHHDFNHDREERGRIFDRNFYSRINERVSKMCWWWRLMLKAIVQFLLLRHFQELFNFIIFVKSFVTFFCQILNNTRTFIFLCGILFMQHFICTFIIKK